MSKSKNIKKYYINLQHFRWDSRNSKQKVKHFNKIYNKKYYKCQKNKISLKLDLMNTALISSKLKKNIPTA